MSERVLTLRELNRATLSRQLLLERAELAIPAAIERLVGLQAQALAAPFIGLWTRLPDFKREDLARLIEAQTVVKATTMRTTLHLLTAGDYLRFRTTLHPMLKRASDGATRLTKTALFDVDKVLAASSEFITEKPRTFSEIETMLAALIPDADRHAMKIAVRMLLPLVQVPVSSGWSYPGNPAFALADSWLGQPTDPNEYARELVLRYLAVFGPASVKDMQIWSGITGLKEVFESLRKELCVYRDEDQRELFDLPDIELPDVDTAAPVRFLPEFDNILLSHEKRTRIIADEYRPKVYIMVNGRILSTILVNGFVSGIWKVEKKKRAATLLIEPFITLSPHIRAELTEEGERLVRFIEPTAETFEVRFTE
jgi:hypothetical protein